MEVTKTINIKDFVVDTENYLKEIKSTNEPILIYSDKYCVIMTLKYFQSTIDESLRKGIEIGKAELKDCINEYNLKYLDIENTDGKEEIK